MQIFLFILIAIGCTSCNQETAEERFERRITKQAPEAQEELKELKKKVNIQAQELVDKIDQEQAEEKK